LWPEGVKSGGINVKTDLPGITKKMTSFVKIYKNYTKEQIIEATKYYLEDRKKQNWYMIQRAHYFISKDGISSLASNIEDLGKRTQEYKNYQGI